MHHHDALTFLPRASVLSFPKGRDIYDRTGRPSCLYLVLSGTVKLNCTASDGSQMLIRIVPPEGFFGESSLIPQTEPMRETAISATPTQLISWNADEVESHIERQPRLSLALCEYFEHRNEQMRERIVAAATQQVGIRVRLTLIQLAHEIGDQRTDGARRLVGITHQALAGYIGTSREIVTGTMNRLRTQGYVQYSRQYIDVYTDALAESIRTAGFHVSESATSAQF